MRILKRNRGVHADRYSREPEEKAFAEAWNRINRGQYSNGAHTLIHLLLPPKSQLLRAPDRPDRDYLVAATVIQWLGSTMGQFFLSELGYEKAEPRKRGK